MQVRISPIGERASIQEPETVTGSPDAIAKDLTKMARDHGLVYKSNRAEFKDIGDVDDAVAFINTYSDEYNVSVITR